MVKNKRRHGLFFFILALIIAIASTWVNKTWISYQKYKNEYDQQSKISHYFADFNVTQHHADGSLDYKLSGKHLSHWSGTKSSEISELQIVSYEDKKPSFNMTAAQAIMRNEEKVLELHDSIIIKDLQSDPISVLTTDFLRYYPDKKWINTESQVKFVSGTTILTGKGMDSKLDENKLRIHADVHSTFEKK